MKKTTNLILFLLLFMFSFVVAEKAQALTTSVTGPNLSICTPAEYCSATIIGNYSTKVLLNGSEINSLSKTVKVGNTISTSAGSMYLYSSNSGVAGATVTNDFSKISISPSISGPVSGGKITGAGTIKVIYTYPAINPVNYTAYISGAYTAGMGDQSFPGTTYFPAQTITYTLTATGSAVNASCGSNVRTSTSPYSSSTTSWPSTSSTAFCASGTAPSTPTFPSAGSSTSWTCTGSNGGSSASCVAYRAAAPINGSCGSNATNYPYSSTSYSGTFCLTGTASPASPAFPTPGGSTSWTCNGSNGGVNRSCLATRTSPPPPANVIPTASINSPSSNQAIKSGVSISFSGSGTDSDGTISGYEWRLGNCSTGTLLSSSSSFSRNFSSVGTYNIYLRVKDNSNAYSTNCPSRTITVSAAASGSTGSCTKNLVYMPVTIGGGPNDCRGVGCVGMSEGQSCSSEGSGCMVACTEMSGVQLLVCMDPACSYDIYNRTVSCPPCNYSCTGTIPANAAAYDAEESTGLTANTAWSPSTSDTATKCQYRCNSGYNWNGSSCAPIVNASCGSNVRTSTSPYSSSTTSWPSTSSTAFCASGTAPSTPTFPSAGSSTSWTCTGSNGGSSASCVAYRAAAPINGSCGSNATNYPYSSTSYSGTFCLTGTASPASPAFPTPGGSTSWTCNGSNGGVNRSCLAIRNAMCTVNTAPTATITAPTANRTITAGTSVSFTGTASDPDGNTITNYEWRVGSCTGTLLSSSSSFSYTFSNVGTYNIYFRAYDGCTWSACQSRTITVNAGTSGSTGSCTKNLVYMPVTIGGGPNDCRGVGCVGMSEGQSCSSEGSGCMVACTEMSGVQLLVCMDPACSYDIYNRTVSCPPCSCTGSIPTNNATMCTGDSTTTAALPWQNVPLNGCTTRKCEFFCDSGYNYNPATNTCAPIIRGSCGTNAQTYSYDATAYPGTSFCLTGTASPASPAFPSEGNSVTWTCSGGDNTISTDDVNCSATRNNARSCAIPWSTTGETVTSGNALTVYPSATVPCGSTCAPQYRLCVDGTLESGSSIVRCEPEDCPNPPSYSSWKEVRP